MLIDGTHVLFRHLSELKYGRDQGGEMVSLKPSSCFASSYNGGHKVKNRDDQLRKFDCFVLRGVGYRFGGRNIVMNETWIEDL
jgi:hypothetical protein